MESDEVNDEQRYAHRFAIEHLRDANRAFWTRVAALLTVNSLLVAGFTLLYGSENSNDTLLLAIAASGIAIQAVWPIFAVSSFPIVEYLRQLMRDIERYDTIERDDIEPHLTKVWTHYERHCQEFYEELLQQSRFWKWFSKKGKNTALVTEKDEATEESKKALGRLLRHFWGNYPAGLLATAMFFAVFLAIWIVAAAIVNIIVAIVVGIISFLFAALLCISFWKRKKNAPIKAVR